MKFNLLGLTLAGVVLSTAYFGCAVVEQKAGGDSKVGSGTRTASVEEPTITAAKPKKKVTVDIDNGACTAMYKEEPDGKIKDLEILTGPCTKEETASLTINGKTVVDIGRPVQFTTEGSCRYCYINSNREMTCIVYNVATCP